MGNSTSEETSPLIHATTSQVLIVSPIHVDVHINIWMCTSQDQFHKLLAERKYRNTYIILPTWLKMKDVNPYLLIPYMRTTVTVIGLVHPTKKRLITYEQALKETQILGMKYVEISKTALSNYLSGEND